MRDKLRRVSVGGRHPQHGERQTRYHCQASEIGLKKGAEESKISVAKLFYYQVIPKVVGH